jgi:hypothetical protein
MIERIIDSEDAEFCKCILGVVLASYRPITLDELSSSVNMPDGFSDDDGFLVEMILACGSFLTMRDRTIFFVHQSAKDFLRHRLNVIFPETTTSAINQARASISPKYTLKDSERDSGYASASRPATLGVSSESAFNDNMESISLRNPREPKFPHDNDIQSLASDSDDINSQASNETTSEAITGKALIRVFLVEEPNFRPLCEKAMTRMGTQRFVENLRRLLKSFHKNLATEAEVEAEKSVARLLRSRRGRLRICQQLVIHIEQEREEARQDERFNLDIAPNAKQHVEKWLTQTFGRELELEELQDQVLNDDSSDSDDNSGRDEFPYISGMENFLRGSRSFQILLKDFMLMFLPAELRHVLLSIPKRHIWVSQEQDLSLPNRLKAWVEDSTQVRWRWWPLKSRKRMLQEGESRMFWRCVSSKY